MYDAVFCCGSRGDGRPADDWRDHFAMRGFVPRADAGVVGTAALGSDIELGMLVIGVVGMLRHLRETVFER